MRMKRLICIFSLWLSATDLSFCQTSPQAEVKGYKGQSHLFFDSVFRRHQHELSKLDGAIYELYVTFDIDTLNRASNLQIHELSVCPISSAIKKVVTAIFRAANGKWQLPATDRKAAKQQVWAITLMKADQSFDERVNALSRYDDYYFGTLGEQDTVIYRIRQTKKQRELALLY